MYQKISPEQQWGIFTVLNLIHPCQVGENVKYYLLYTTYTHSFFIVCASSPLSTMGVFATVFWIDILTEELILHKKL